MNDFEKEPRDNKKIITLTLLLFLALLGFSSVGISGLPPTTIRGWFDTTAKTVFNFFVPNKTATKTSTGYLIETGNANILANPSWESAAVIDSWTYSPTPILETSDVIDGKQSLMFTPSAQAFELSQDSTINATGFSGATTQGLASVRVKVSSATNLDIQVCPRKAGAIMSAPYCVSVPRDGVWHLIKIPFVLGGTSNGISVHSLGYANVTGTIQVDNAFVGPVDLKSEVDAISNWQTYTPTFANMGTVTISYAKWRQVGQNVEVIIKGTTGTVVSATQSFSLPNNYTTSSSLVSPQTVGRIARASASTTYFGSSVIAAPSSNVLNFGSQSSTLNEYTINTLSTFGNSEAFSLYASVPVNELQASGTIYNSTNSDTGWSPCNFSTLAWQGLGTVTNNLRCKRQGSDLLITGNFVTGTVAASAAQMPLPLWNGSQLSTISSYPSGSTGDIVAKGNRTISSTTFFGGMTLNATNSKTYLHVSCEASTVSGEATATNGNACFSNSDQLSFMARVTIAGWDDSNIIIGQFNGLESCASTLECTDEFSAKVSSADAVSDESYDFINGNCTNATTGTATCTYNSGIFTVTPNCTATSVDTSSNNNIQITAQSASAITILTAGNGSAADKGFTLKCSRTGVDKINKTAKAVASDQNVRSDLVDAVLYSFSTNSSGTVSNEKGDPVSGNCSAATNIYTCTWSSSKFIDTPNCTCNVLDAASSTFVRSCQILALSQTQIQYMTIAHGTSTTSATPYGVSVVCHGTGY